MTHFRWFLLLILSTSTASAADPEKLSLNLRCRVQPFKGSEEWLETSLKKDFIATETAIVVCDMWDKHWCPSATQRCGEIALKMNPILEAARKKGVLIVHAPSDTMDFYKDAPARKRILELPKIELPKALQLPDPPCPVDDSDGGCDDSPSPKSFRAWSRQHEALKIDQEKDYISDNGTQIYALFKEKGIRNVLLMGVHTNMCVLHRTFAIKPMTRLGMKCLLVRDLTDSMYNPKMRPFVTHDEGTQRIVEHIEKYWCPTILSTDLK